MRRIALVCDWYSPRRGGIEAHLDGLATRLAARGDDVRVITSTPGPAEVNGIPVHRLGVRLLPFADVSIDPVARPIQALLEKHGVDVVHSHVSIIAPVALGGALATHRARLPGVVTFHSFVPGTPIWAAITGRLLGADHWRSHMTAVSRRVADQVAPFAKRRTFDVLPNAIDTAFWTPGPIRSPSSHVNLLFAGRLSAKKEPMVALHAARHLRRSSPRLDFLLRICGTGPLESSLRNFVERNDLSDRVKFLGWRAPAELLAIMRDSDIFLATARRESFGLAALEARSTGLPVVAMRTSAVSEFISEPSGILVDSAADFAAAVTDLATNAGRRAEIVRHNRETASGLGWDESLSIHTATYDAAIAAWK